MKRISYVILIALAIVVIGFLMVLYNFAGGNKDKKNEKVVSVVLYDNEADRWDTLKQGINQAAKDYDVEVNFYNSSSDYESSEQAAIISREYNNGVNGIVVAPTDSDKIVETIENTDLTIPVVLVDSSINTDRDIPTIEADNKGMGAALAKEIKKDIQESQQIVVISNNESRNSIIERKEGFEEAFGKENIVYWYLPNTDIDTISEKIANSNEDIIVALDSITLENVAAALSEEGSHIKLYGLGNTNNIAVYLDGGIIDKIVFQNEFNMGYLAISKLADASSYTDKELEKLIGYKVISKDDMYSDENQRLLFPNVQ